MSPTRVVNRRTERYDEYIGRGSIFGNPFEIGRDGTREQVIDRYREWFNRLITDHRFRALVTELRDKTLGCYCAPDACHGDVIAGYLDR